MAQRSAAWEQEWWVAQQAQRAIEESHQKRARAVRLERLKVRRGLEGTATCVLASSTSAWFSTAQHDTVCQTHGLLSGTRLGSNAPQSGQISGGYSAASSPRLLASYRPRLATPGCPCITSQA